MNHTDVITKSLPDCCLERVADITSPYLAQSVVCDKTHRVTWIGEEEGWHSTAQPKRKYAPKRPLTSTDPAAGPYTSNDVVRICGTSLRKLDYWIRQGWVDSVQVMTQTGWSRRFTERAIHRVKELERASRFKALRLDRMAVELRSYFEWKRKARSTSDVPVQGELL